MSRQLRVVVCDDAPDIRELMSELLVSVGHEVTMARDGKSAIAAIIERKPDVALIDIGLPDVDGYAVARAIRRAIGGKPLRLVALTGYAQAHDRKAALEAGFDDHLVKPASMEKILRALAGSARTSR